MNEVGTAMKQYIKQMLFKAIIYYDAEAFTQWKYARCFKKKPDLENPKTFNEKVSWIAIHYQNPLYTQCADKIEVKNYVVQKLGAEEAEKLFCKKYGIWDNPEDIDFDTLPDSFVLKSNHASGQVILCNKKSELNIRQAKKQMKKWLSINFYYSMGEWQYKNVAPRIICEELLESNIVDYRIFCFEGKPTYIKVTRHNANAPGGYDYNMYYPDWTVTEFRMAQKYGEMNLKKPKQLDYMLNLATKLSEDFHFVRVDFFITNDTLYFAELTFTPNSGCEKYTDDAIDLRFGEMFDLPDDEYVK